MRQRIMQVFISVVIFTGTGCSEEPGFDEESKLGDLIYQQEIRLNVSTEAVWEAITAPEIVSSYYLAPLVKLEMAIGGEIVYGSVEHPMISGTILELEAPKRLVHSFVFDPVSHEGLELKNKSRVAYDLIPDGNGTILKLTHDQFGGDSQAFADVQGGWPIILSGLTQQVQSGGVTD